MQVQKAQLLNAISQIRAERGMQGIKRVQTPSVNQAERQMITKNFPANRQAILDMYRPNGQTVSENPTAKGRVVDFRV
jgi:hypothetical protein